MNYSHFSSLGYAVPHHSGYRVVNPAKQFSGKRSRENYSSLPSMRASPTGKVETYDREGGIDDFVNFIRPYDVSFIWFFAPWCGHCQIMEDDFKNAARQLGDKIQFINVDADKHRDIGAANEVKGFPTLKLFRKGIAAHEYEGPRNTKSFIKWLEEHA
jgi:thiol-disulfide isomerase/thioredoxin